MISNQFHFSFNSGIITDTDDLLWLAALFSIKQRLDKQTQLLFSKHMAKLCDVIASHYAVIEKSMRCRKRSAM